MLEGSPITKWAIADGLRAACEARLKNLERLTRSELLLLAERLDATPVKPDSPTVMQPEVVYEKDVSGNVGRKGGGVPVAFELSVSQHRGLLRYCDGLVVEDVLRDMVFRVMDNARHTGRKAADPIQKRGKAKGTPTVTESRNCMTCGKQFQSHGNHNRMCGRCRDLPATME